MAEIDRRPSAHGDADENVAQEAKSSSLHQKSGEPAGNRANNQGYGAELSA